MKFNFTEEQIRIIDEGVRNKMDYKDIAKQVGGVSAMQITRFLHFRVLNDFQQNKASLSLEVNGE